MNRTSKKLLPARLPYERRHPLQDGGVRITTFEPLQFRNRGIKKVVVGPDGVDEPVAINASSVAFPPTQNHTLLKALALAHFWENQIHDGVDADAREIAQLEQMKITRVREVLRLAILDPHITQAILDGWQPRTASLESLVRESLPLDWEAQREMITNFCFRSDGGKYKR